MYVPFLSVLYGIGSILTEMLIIIYKLLIQRLSIPFLRQNDCMVESILDVI